MCSLLSEFLQIASNKNKLVKTMNFSQLTRNLSVEIIKNFLKLIISVCKPSSSSLSVVAISEKFTHDAICIVKQITNI